MDLAQLVHPLLLILAPAVPLALLSWRWGIYPRAPLVGLFAIPVLFSALLAAWPTGLLFVYALDTGLALVALWDLRTVPRRADFQLWRKALRIVSLGKPHPVELTVINTSARRYAIEVRDDVPALFAADTEEFKLLSGGRSRADLHYRLTASRRGAHALEQVYLRVRSAWNWWQRDLRYPVLSVLHVYPDLKQLGEFAVLARTNRLSLLGVRRTRKVGQDNEFERLRDFSPDDVYKHIDWRATARRRRLTVKEFQSNQSQRLMFVIDCGRMMTNTAGGLSLLDHAFNSMLMLAYVALSRGDSVGLLTFSDEIHSYLPPKSGMTQMNRLLHACFDRFPRLVESRYDEALLYLDTHCRKRSLVVLTTNLVDEVNAAQLTDYLGASTARHLSLGVLLRDRTWFDAAQTAGRTSTELYRGAAAADLLLWRQQVLHGLKTRGVRCLDVFPEELTAPLINSYLEIKARHLL